MKWPRLINVIALVLLVGCGKKTADGGNPPAASFILNSWSLNGISAQPVYNVPLVPIIRFSFSSPINRSTVSNSISLSQNTAPVLYTVNYFNGDSTLLVSPSAPLVPLTTYKISLSNNLQSSHGGKLVAGIDINFNTAIDSSDKFPQISDSALVELVQKQTFKYFWVFAHPVSGLARERSNGDNRVVTSGGSGFGVMAIITAIHRGFISRNQGVTRMQTIVGFLKNTAQKFHKAFPHWLDGQTGAVFPFSQKDNGADLVETSYLMQGLLCARQYFNGGDAAETTLRNDINAIWQGVEWNFFRKNNENVLYWHWSPSYNWDINMPVRGWNEALITYVLAASSPAYSIPKIVYDNGWAQSGAIKNNGTFYGHTLPLGPNYGGPLFFSHYSFLGINPKGLADQYANYETQVVNHTKINYEYCKSNPNNFYGYSDQSWGLTASDIPNSYSASSPTNDIGVIAPTAALSSFPYTPVESMKALKFFYYKLGDKLWGEYGFRDAFSLKEPWFANSYLAIDQGPIVVMLENYRSGLLWNLFMSCPEVKTGMKNLGFQSPYL